MPTDTNVGMKARCLMAARFNKFKAKLFRVGSPDGVQSLAIDRTGAIDFPTSQETDRAA